MSHKVKTFSEVSKILETCREEGEKIVQCHGVFDLLHPGHIKHLSEAKRLGDKLIVTVTPDRFVNKGPGRPAFSEHLRAEQLAALSAVDYVILNDQPDAISAIEQVKPALYVKGVEYQDHGKDVTGKISEEAAAVESVGGQIHYTDDVVFSSSGLINRYVDHDAERIRPFMETMREVASLEQLLEMVEALTDLKVLIVGDAIIDEYQYVTPLGQSGKGLHMTAALEENEVFLGGSLIIANHIAQYAGEVTLLTAIGGECPFRDFINKTLDPRVNTEFLEIERMTTLIKRRYVQHDGHHIMKLFETYSSNAPLLDEEMTDAAVNKMREKAKEVDLVLVCDFGNGFTNPRLIKAFSDAHTFLALNTQVNSGNRGYNVVTHYPHADFISLNEPELRLAAHDLTTPVERLVHDMALKMHAPEFSVTRGVNGVYYFSRDRNSVSIPALTTQSVDRVGAGDSYFSLAAMCSAKGYRPIVSGFLGSVAAAIDVQIVGNREPVQKPDLCKYLTRLMK